MERVLLGLLPVQLGAVYFFGWRALVMTLLMAAVGAGVERAMARHRGDPLTTSVFVTAALFSLSLPPGCPFWIGTVGIVVAVLFGKEVFGGFGRNIFNPAVVGRAFIYELVFELVSAWLQPVKHEVYHGDHDHGFAVLGQTLVILA
jgi:Na+-transporting NADH:ubiquinone oxidoreductase subunit B